ncbi:MAG: GTPase Era [Acidiferrobacterales bacterium]
MTTADFRSGFIAVIGRPNVGKSTLVNCLVGQKVSITSRRPQTTRHRILGIKTTSESQLVYVDSPGVHTGGAGTMNQYMNRAAIGSVEGVDCLALVISVPRWLDEDAPALALARRQTCPVLLVINKIDRIGDRAELLPLIRESHEKMPFAEIIPVSAENGDNIAELEATVLRYLPKHPPQFPPDQVSDRNDRFMASELVREQVFRSLGQEVPYAVAVMIDSFRQETRLIHIDATIFVEKDGQKAILIGKDGARLKEIGRRARLEMQKLFGSKVYLGLWVKVREGWSDDARVLRSLGYGDDS